MSALPILYSFRRCPYAMRARMALHIAGVTCELREVVLRDKPEEMIAASPKATVPVLVLPNGRVIDESRDVMLWALGENDPEGWLLLDRTEADGLIETNDGPFKHQLDRYKYATRYDVDPLEHRAAALEILRGLDTRLAERANLLGAERSLPDIALFPFIRQFANTDRDWFDAQPLPHLQGWLTRHLESDLFKAIMVKRPQWQAGDDPVIFADHAIAA